MNKKMLIDRCLALSVERDKRCIKSESKHFEFMKYHASWFQLSIRGMLSATEWAWSSLNKHQLNYATNLSRESLATHLNGAVEKAIVLSWPIEESFCVGQLVMLVCVRSEEIHGEMSGHRRSIWWPVMRLERRADSHFIVWRLNYHVVSTPSRLQMFSYDHLQANLCGLTSFMQIRQQR